MKKELPGLTFIRGKRKLFTLNREIIVTLERMEDIIFAETLGISGFGFTELEALEDLYQVFELHWERLVEDQVPLSPGAQKLVRVLTSLVERVEEITG